MRKNFGAKPFLYPQPVMILGTYDENGKANAMNAAWGGIVGANEIIVDLSAHKTTDNIIKNKAFTVGVADLEHLVACDLQIKKHIRCKKQALLQRRVNM